MVKAVAEWMPAKPWACPDGQQILPYTASRQDWLTVRRRSVGASEVAAVLGLARWRGSNPWAVWAEKTGRTPGSEITRAMVRGLMLERAVVDLWVAEDATFPIVIRRRGVMRSKAHPVLTASLDFLSACPNGRCCVEVKTQGDTSDWDGDEVPLEYQIQGQIQLLVTGRHHVHFVAMGARFGIQHRVMYRDEEMMAILAARVTDWWDYHVVGENPPPATGDNLAGLRSGYGNPSSEDIAVELPEHLWGHPARAERLEEQKAAIEVELDTLEAQVCAAMGDATVGTIDGQPAVTWRRSKRIDGATKDFVRRNRELVSPYMTKVEALTEVAELVTDHPELLTDGRLRYRRTFHYVPSPTT